jgi:hypothetical protein
MKLTSITFAAAFVASILAIPYNRPKHRRNEVLDDWTGAVLAAPPQDGSTGFSTVEGS